jgi:hypothetical protein
MRKMSRVPAWKTGDPIERSDNGMRAEMKEIGVLANREMPDARPFFQNQMARENPRQPDPTRGMNGIAKLRLQDATPHFPRKQQRKKQEGFL